VSRPQAHAPLRGLSRPRAKCAAARRGQLAASTQGGRRRAGAL